MEWNIEFAIYGEGFVKPVVQGIYSRSLRTSPSPSASVDLPHFAGTQVSSCAFCRISLEPEAEGDPCVAPPSVRLRAWGRRGVNAQPSIRDRRRSVRRHEEKYEGRRHSV